MDKIITTDEFVELLSKKASFTKKDTKDFLNALIEIFEEAVESETILKIYGFGKLVFQNIDERKVKSYTTKNGDSVPEKTLPPTKRVTYKLAENIRYRHKEE